MWAFALWKEALPDRLQGASVRLDVVCLVSLGGFMLGTWTDAWLLWSLRNDSCNDSFELTPATSMDRCWHLLVQVLPDVVMCVRMYCF